MVDPYWYVWNVQLGTTSTSVTPYLTNATIEYGPIWQSWNLPTGTATTNLWRTWNGTTTSQTIVLDAAWGNWLPIQGYQTITLPVAAGRTPAEQRKYDRDQVALRRTYDRELKARQRAEAVAKKRAERLLLAHLSPEQRDEYERLQRFHVVGADGKLYRIRRGWSHNVELIEESDEGRFLTEQFCIHPIERVPDEDNLLAQKLLLETDPERFRRIANITRLHRRDEPVAVPA